MKRLKKKKSEKAQLLKQGLADARKGRVRKVKEEKLGTEIGEIGDGSYF